MLMELIRDWMMKILMLWISDSLAAMVYGVYY